MNPFSSDKAPYAIALLISAVGWMLGGLHGSVQDSLIAAYAVRHHDDRAVITVTNLSKKKAIGPVRFKISCAEGVDCFAAPDGVIDVGFAQGGLIDLPPELAILGDGSTARSVYVDAVLPPGAPIAIDARLTKPGAPVALQFVPNATKPEALYIVPAASPFAFFVAHYYLLMVTVSAVLVALFGGWLATQTFAPPARKEPPDEKQPPAAGGGARPRRNRGGGTGDGQGGQPG